MSPHGIKPQEKANIIEEMNGGEEKMRAVKEEVEKLLDIGFIKEIMYPTW